VPLVSSPRLDLHDREEGLLLNSRTGINAPGSGLLLACLGRTGCRERTMRPAESSHHARFLRPSLRARPGGSGSGKASIADHSRSISAPRSPIFLRFSTPGTVVVFARTWRACSVFGAV
jgi:hypothetical protein